MSPNTTPRAARKSSATRDRAPSFTVDASCKDCDHRMSSDQLRIAIVAPYDLSRPGGVNNQIRAQARALRRLGHSARIFGPVSSRLEEAETSRGRFISITMFGPESRLGLDPRGIPAVSRMLREPF